MTLLFKAGMEKRQRTAALQNLAETRLLSYSRSVLECGCPLPLLKHDANQCAAECGEKQAS